MILDSTYWPMQNIYKADIAFSDIVSVLKDPIRLYKTYKSRNNSKGRLALRFQIEQSPRYSNFISLNDETDLIGLKKANLHWTFSEIERHTVDIAISYAAKAFQKINGGSLKLDPDMISDHRDLPQDLRGGQHHCGTTRMSNNSKHGVVDSNLKLFDADNVFVCGSSVFPTNGWVNPTFTIIALSFRLSKHLANRYR
jgi:choline dehydrogenase-like flavoprotein